jgi:hypothetical protein
MSEPDLYQGLAGLTIPEFSDVPIGRSLPVAWVHVSPCSSRPQEEVFDPIKIGVGIVTNAPSTRDHVSPAPSPTIDARLVEEVASRLMPLEMGGRESALGVDQLLEPFESVGERLAFTQLDSNSH